MTILGVIFLLAILAAIFCAIGAIKLRLEGFDDWESRWKICKVASIVAACIFPVIFMHGQFENLQNAEDKLVSKAHEEAYASAEADKSPYERFQNCLDGGWSINQCRNSIVGDDYEGWMRDRGQDEETIQYMSEEDSQGRSTYAESLNEIAEGR